MGGWTRSRSARAARLHSRRLSCQLLHGLPRLLLKLELVVVVVVVVVAVVVVVVVLLGVLLTVLVLVFFAALFLLTRLFVLSSCRLALDLLISVAVVVLTCIVVVRGEEIFFLPSARTCSCRRIQARSRAA